MEEFCGSLVEAMTTLKELSDLQHADEQDFHHAILRFLAVWPQYCHGTSLATRIVEDVDSLSENLLSELIIINDYLQRYSNPLFRSGLLIARNGLVSAFIAYARFWMGQVALADLLLSVEDHTRFLEGECKVLTDDCMAAAMHARQTRRQWETHS